MKAMKWMGLLGPLVWSAMVWAQPSLINYQGRLLDAGGEPFNGVVPVEVRLFDSDTGGVAIWQQTITNVEVVNGLYHFQFGDTNLADALDESEIWLELVIDSELMSPRQRLVAVPYALWAEQLADAGKIVGGTLSMDRFPANPSFVGQVGINTTSPGAGLGINQVDSRQILMQRGSQDQAWGLSIASDGRFNVISTEGDGTLQSEAISILPDGRVGIGTDDPREALGVQGNIRVTGGMMLNAAGRSSYVTDDANAWVYSSSHVFEDESNMHGALILQSRSTAGRPIVFVTGSTPTERMRLHASGDLTLEGNDLSVGGNNNDPTSLWLRRDPGHSWRIRNEGGNLSFVGGANNPSAERLNINTSGDISVGGTTVINSSGNIAHHNRIPNLPASKITSGTLPVSRGGTGRSSLSNNRLLIGNGTGGVDTRSDLHIQGSAGYWGVSLRTPVLRPQGIQGKQGVNSTTWGQPYNIWWTGTGAELWVDNTNLGFFMSDRRLKTDLRTLPGNAIERVMAMEPIQYRYKNIEGSIFTGSDQMMEGFIADELQAIIPSAVKGEPNALTDDGQIQPQQLEPMPIIAVLTQAMQEQQAIIEAQQAQIDAQQAQLEDLLKRMTELEER